MGRSTRSTWRITAAMLVLSGALASCSSSDSSDGASAESTSPPAASVDTTAAPTTVAPTTTAAPATTLAPAPAAADVEAICAPMFDAWSTGDDHALLGLMTPTASAVLDEQKPSFFVDSLTLSVEDGALVVRPKDPKTRVRLLNTDPLTLDIQELQVGLIKANEFSPSLIVNGLTLDLRGDGQKPLFEGGGFWLGGLAVTLGCKLDNPVVNFLALRIDNRHISLSCSKLPHNTTRFSL